MELWSNDDGSLLVEMLGENRILQELDLGYLVLLD